MPSSSAHPGTILTGKEVYDRLMATVDSDLVSASLPTLEERYAKKGETPAQRKARMARYKKSFAAYDKKYQAFLMSLHGKVMATRRAALQKVEASARADDDKLADDLLSQMASA
ncbi:hypothetical protein HY213_02930 [Candidatus Peregrinibacteria bacterium]|nr:hypothetical protein [Candidatus Peregrinibacteria bacterium]